MSKSLSALKEILDTAELRRVMTHRRIARNRAKRARLARFRADYPGMPHYYRSVLEYVQAWIEARHRPGGWERVSLRALVYCLRIDAARALGEDGAQIKGRGVGKILRELGIKTTHEEDGLWVSGVWDRRFNKL